jgi:hypothetical protein
MVAARRPQEIDAMTRLILGLSLALLLAAPFRLPAPVTAHFLGCSSVEKGDIHWEGNTVFATARDYAISTWDGLASVDISKDTIWTNADLKIMDVNRSDVIWAGLYTDRDCGNADDRIRFNRFFMDGFTDAQKKMAALHELGHALGLGHSFSNNVMNPFVTSQTGLGTHDKDDYWALWGRPFGSGGGSDEEPVCGPHAC